MSRPLGGYIGYDAEPATTAAPGIWTLRDAELYQRKGQWPVPFAPDQLTGLQLWLDASDSSTLYDATTGGSLVAADGGVARWEDKSGNDRHATQGTAGSRPARKTAIQGGLDVLRFDGSDDILSVPSSTATFKFLHRTVGTVFIVGKNGTSANPDAIHGFLGNRGASGSNTGFETTVDDRSTFSFNDLLRVNIAAGSGSTVNVARISAADLAPANTYIVMSHVLDVANGTAADRVASRVNGGAANKSNTDSNSPSTGNASYDLQVGAVGNGALPLDGDIAEIIIYDSALSDTDREAVENYLLAKWGIT